MSHTNTTANYNLPQFTGTDKPSWLTDVNGAMTSIDTQMKANADANTTTAGGLSTLTGRVTTAEENITTLGSQLSTNESGSSWIVYCIVDINGAGGTSPLVITLSDSGLRPATPITINSGAMVAVYNANGFKYMEVMDMTINTNGTVSISVPSQPDYTIVRCMITPYVIFAKDFGD